MEQIERIKAMEEKFDRLTAVVNNLDNAAQAYQDSLPLLEELLDYYENGLWQVDYEADEAGLIPHDLKRGILSQDGLYDLLYSLQRSKDILCPPQQTE